MERSGAMTRSETVARKGKFPWKVGMSIHAQAPPDFHQLQQAGIQYIELIWHGLDIFDPEIRMSCEEIISNARRHNVEVWSIHIPYGDDWDPSNMNLETRNETIRKVRKVLLMANRWGVHTAVFHPSYEPILAEEREKRLKICQQTLGMIVQGTEELDVSLAIECLPRTCLGNCADEIEYLLEGSKNLTVCCDVNHLFKESPEQFIRQIGSRIRTIHISDHDGLDERHWMPGDGVLQWKETLDTLLEIDYRGAFMYEVRKQPPNAVMDNWLKLNR